MQLDKSVQLPLFLSSSCLERVYSGQLQQNLRRHEDGKNLYRVYITKAFNCCFLKESAARLGSVHITESATKRFDWYFACGNLKLGSRSRRPIGLHVKCLYISGQYHCCCGGSHFLNCFCVFCPVFMISHFTAVIMINCLAGNGPTADFFTDQLESFISPVASIIC